MQLKIFMKSGNVIKLRGIKNYTVKALGNEVTTLDLEMYRWRIFKGHTIAMAALDLSQIEAITRF